MSRRDRDPQRTWIVGPRRVGGRYYSGYWRQEYTVLAVEKDVFGGWWITQATDEELAEGRSRRHCTSWDKQRDRVVREPDEVATEAYRRYWLGANEAGAS